MAAAADRVSSAPNKPVQGEALHSEDQVRPAGSATVVLAMAAETAELQFGPAEWERLRSISRPQQRVLTAFDDASLPLLADAEILITSWGCPTVDDRVVAAAPRLRALVHAAGSVRAIAGDAVWDRGITVSSMADLNGLPVAEYVLAMILLENKRVLESIEEFARRRDRPTGDWYGDRLGNYGKTIGLVSASRIGRRVAELLRAFEFDVIISDPFCDADEIAALGARKVELDELFRTSDIVSVHAPLLPETIGMINADLLARLRDGATLINTSRGKIIDEPALIKELQTGRIRAILDVTHPEPPEPGSPLWTLPNVVLTPHIAGSKGVEVRRMANGAIDEAERILTDRPLQFQVPPERRHTFA
ncbi:hydroxyacid dehydrogenase [Microlunatus elymi]|uniref:Hydroxyacid dehydrogenase n=1 Tax=Microlunatus elymi TaxID=2596828 RepID=A0A516Q444_9ACTN|nr:hydroxyacid dehydrogenase [Microlunatus elymi]QDP98142.1 hydroxyacid dehydrogenase [Microlunatus elymi]